MSNPFAEIYERLGNIEGFLLALDEKLTPTLPQPTDGKKYLTAKEAAEFMGIKQQTLYQNIEQVPHIKKHGKLHFVKADLVAYMEEGRKEIEQKKGGRK
ncbi:MAG TPA: hypothetical protein DCM71_12360 [Runella sp.]|nr:hypothetical protein [Runella sp.]